MGYMNLFLANLPNGFWQNLIGYFVDFVGNYGLAIILFSIALKIVLSPLDFMQRKITKSNTEKQAKLKPQLDKLQKKYANNKETLNQKTMELYKKENYNIIGSCLGMLVNLALTLVIFITLFSAMRHISEFKLADQYSELQTAYNSAYDIEYAIESNTENAILKGQEAVLDKYLEVKEGFLWVSNVWMPDTQANVIPNYERFLVLSNLSEENRPTEEKYNEVMGILQQEYSGWNGYYILIILAGAVTYFSQKVMQGKIKQTNDIKAKNTDSQETSAMPQMNGKFMQILLPALMVIFTISYSAAFALYIVINSLMTLIISIIANKIIDKLEAKKEEKNKLSYSR